MGIRSTINEQTGVITWAIRDGDNVIDQISFDTKKCAPEVLAYAVFHGLKQKVQDESALGRGTPDVEKLTEMGRLIRHLENGGSWSMRTAGESRESGGLVLRAVAAIQGLSVEEMRARLAEKAEKMRTTERKLLAQLKNSDTVKAKMAELSPGPENAAIAADSLMEELMK